jgi:hypothetical protein
LPAAPDRQGQSSARFFDHHPTAGPRPSDVAAGALIVTAAGINVEIAARDLDARKVLASYGNCVARCVR